MMEAQQEQPFISEDYSSINASSRTVKAGGNRSKTKRRQNDNKDDVLVNSPHISPIVIDDDGAQQQQTSKRRSSRSNTAMVTNDETDDVSTPLRTSSKKISSSLKESSSSNNDNNYKKNIKNINNSSAFLAALHLNVNELSNKSENAQALEETPRTKKKKKLMDAATKESPKRKSKVRQMEPGQKSKLIETNDPDAEANEKKSARRKSKGHPEGGVSKESSAGRRSKGTPTAQESKIQVSKGAPRRTLAMLVETSGRDHEPLPNDPTREIPWKGSKKDRASDNWKEDDFFPTRKEVKKSKSHTEAPEQPISALDVNHDAFHFPELTSTSSEEAAALKLQNKQPAVRGSIDDNIRATTDVKTTTKSVTGQVNEKSSIESGIVSPSLKEKDISEFFIADVTFEGSTSSTIFDPSRKSLLHLLEEDEDLDEPLPLYASYTESLVDASGTGETETTSSLNTSAIAGDLSSQNSSSLQRIQIATGNILSTKHILWLDNQTEPESIKSTERTSILKRATIASPVHAVRDQTTPKQRTVRYSQAMPPSGGKPGFLRDTSLPADIAIQPRNENRFSSVTLTRDLQSVEIDINPQDLHLSWGTKKCRDVMKLAINKEGSYRSFGTKNLKLFSDDGSETVVEKRMKKRKILLALIFFVVLPSIIIGITVPIVQKSKDCNCEETLAPSQSPSISMSGLEDLLVQVSADDGDAFMADNTPQSQAFDWLISGTISRSSTETRVVQRYALATIYFATEGDRWSVNSGWLTDNDECEWFSTDQEVCNTDGELINLSLAYNSLRGELPKEVGLLTSLQTLDLTGNGLIGSIPKEVGNMTSLVSLILTDNRIDGVIPNTLQNLSKLDTLVLSQNSILATLPTEIGLLQSLTLLSLASNYISGALPSEIGNLINLRSLRLNVNALVGTLPTELGNVTDLTLIDMSQNFLSGSLPSQLGDLQKLTELDLSLNSFTGSVPSMLGELVSLEKLDLSSNNMTGTVPIQLWQAHIKEILFVNNSLTGSVPDFVCTSLKDMNGLLVVDCDQIFCECCLCGTTTTSKR